MKPNAGTGGGGLPSGLYLGKPSGAAFPEHCTSPAHHDATNTSDDVQRHGDSCDDTKLLFYDAILEIMSRDSWDVTQCRLCHEIAAVV